MSSTEEPHSSKAVGLRYRECAGAGLVCLVDKIRKRETKSGKKPDKEKSSRASWNCAEWFWHFCRRAVGIDMFWLERAVKYVLNIKYLRLVEHSFARFFACSNVVVSWPALFELNS
jgi:hypothetical protein